jgi:cytochrome oxidase assembly protein ShyY1
MLRTALRPRWLALLAVVLLAATGMALLGTWQLDRARQRGSESSGSSADGAGTTAPQPIAEVLRPRQTFPRAAVGVRVTATGTWDGERRLLVAGRELDGRTGFWVLVPLVLDDGSAVPVVRGWVPSASDPAAAPAGQTVGGQAPIAGQTASAGQSAAAGQGGGEGQRATAGQVTVIGRLEPSEPPVTRAPGAASGLPADQLAAISAPELVQRWPYPLLTGYVALQHQTPPAGIAPTPLPAPDTGRHWALRNLSYALQWWLFAGFGLWFWWRVVRDDHLGARPGTTDRAPVSTLGA